jgi:hypothetical protein
MKLMAVPMSNALIEACLQCRRTDGEAQHEQAE